MTAQGLLFKIQLVLDPATKDGQKFNDATAAITISGASNATPIVITTATDHGLVTGNKVYISGVAGNTNANNTGSNPNWTITKVSDTTFSLDDSSGNSAYTSGGYVYPSLVGSVDGASFPRQRILDIYNQARFALYTAINNSYSREDKIKAISGTVVKKTDLQFSAGVANKPDGFMEALRLTDVSGEQITVLPFSLFRQVGKLYAADNRMVFDNGAVLEAPSTSTVIMPNLSTYILYYYGITNFALSDILGGTVLETFNDRFYPSIIELAQAIAAEQGTLEVNALANKLIGAQ